MPPDQEIRFCTAPDGVQIAYSIVGTGPPLVKAPNWLSHLEYEWSAPFWSHWWERLTENHTLLRFDQRGSGLSQRDVGEQSFDTWVSDLGAVVDHAGFDKFSMLGISQGGAISANYIVNNPGRVDRLVVYGGYAQGRSYRGDPQEEIEAQIVLTRNGWGCDDPSYRQMFTSRFMPEASQEQMRSFNELQRISTSPENAATVLEVTSKVDVRSILPQIDVPTLVLHTAGDVVVPFEQGRLIAALVPGARFVPLEGSNHLILADEPGWNKTITEVIAFLKQPAGKDAGSRSSAVSQHLLQDLTARESEVLRLLTAGMTNRQIADELVITPNTAAKHVANILIKTGAANRTEAATFANRSGISKR